MTGQRLGITHIDEPFDEPERVVELLACLEAPLETEGQQRAGTAAEVFLRERVIGAFGEARVVDPVNPVIGAQTLGDASGVLEVSFAMSGRPVARAARASASMSRMLPPALPTLAQKTARGVPAISFSIAAG